MAGEGINSVGNFGGEPSPGVDSVARFARTFLALASLLPAIVHGQSRYTSDAPAWQHQRGIQRDVRYGKDSLQRVDVYTRGRFVGEPKWFVMDTAVHPTFIWIHGGGFVAGDKGDELPYFAAFLQRGWIVVAVNYRLGAGVGVGSMEDVVCAMKWLRAKASSFGIDTTRVVIGGGSAGGTLALVAGTATAKDPVSCEGPAPLRARAIVNHFGIADLLSEDTYLETVSPGQNFERLWAGDSERVKAIDATWSPVRRLSGATPPVYTLHGVRDGVVPVAQSDSLDAALERVGVKHVYQREPNANHGGFTDEQFARFEERLFAFLRGLGF